MINDCPAVRKNEPTRIRAKILLDIIVRIFLDRLHLHIAICATFLFQKFQMHGSIDVFMHLSQITQMMFNIFKAVSIWSVMHYMLMILHSFTIDPIFRSVQYNRIHLFLLPIFIWPQVDPTFCLFPLFTLPLFRVMEGRFVLNTQSLPSCSFSTISCLMRKLCLLIQKH